MNEEMPNIANMPLSEVMALRDKLDSKLYDKVVFDPDPVISTSPSGQEPPKRKIPTKLNLPKLTAYNADQYLKVPSLEKQFLISPPASPPVGWEQQREMGPVVCSFDLMSQLAAFAISDTTYEVHPGSDKHPAIIVHAADKDEIPDPETPYSGGSQKIPQTS